MNREILKKLVEFDTVSCNSNLELIEYCQGLLEKFGFKVILFGNDNKKSLFAYKTEKNRIILAGHTDTVPATNRWKKSPFILTEDNDNYYGLGVTDMKGFFAIALSLIENGDMPDNIALLLTFDEEIDFSGAKSIPKGLVGPSDIIILGEPTNCRAIFANKGLMVYEAKFIGIGGHGSAPEKGISAIESAAQFIIKLKELFKEANFKKNESYFDPKPTLNFGFIKGGSAINKIAEEATVDFEFRICLESDKNLIKQLISKAIKNLKAETLLIEKDYAVPFIGMEVLKSMISASEIEIELGPSYTTEAYILKKFTDKIVIFGPGNSDNAHATDEKISKDKIVEYEKLLHVLIIVLQDQLL